MPAQSFDTVDVLRLEVEGVSPLRNLVRNPDGTDGSWGWAFKVTAGTLTTSAAGIAIKAPSALGNPRTTIHTELLPLQGGIGVGDTRKFVGYVTCVSFSSASIAARISYEYYDKSGTYLGISNYVDRATAGLLSGVTITPPVGTTAVRIRVDVMRTTGSNSTADGLTFTDAIGVFGTAAEVAAYSPVAFPLWQSILGSTINLELTRGELDLGILSGTVRDVTLDPATSTALRRGRLVRLRALSATSGQWERLFIGKFNSANVTYDTKDPRVPVAKRAVITFNAVDRTSALANSARTEGVASIAALPYVLADTGVPFNVNGSSRPVDPDTITVVTRNPNASALDQVAITRDSNRGFAWLDRKGVLQVWDRATITSTVVATLDEDDYSDLGLNFDTTRCINTVTIKYLRFNLATGETVEVTYGPYVDQDSVDRNGPSAAEFTVQGITETDANMEAFATAVLAANANPVQVAETVVLPIATPAHVDRTLLDLCDLVTVANAATSFSQTQRITSITHRIETKKWLMTLGFAGASTVAPPQSVPSPTPAAWAGAAPDGVWVDFNGNWPNVPIASWQVSKYMRVGNTITVRQVATLASGIGPALIDMPFAAANPIFSSVDPLGTIKGIRNGIGWYEGWLYQTSPTSPARLVPISINPATTATAGNWSATYPPAAGWAAGDQWGITYTFEVAP